MDKKWEKTKLIKEMLLDNIGNTSWNGSEALDGETEDNEALLMEVIGDLIERLKKFNGTNTEYSYLRRKKQYLDFMKDLQDKINYYLKYADKDTLDEWEKEFGDK